MNVVFLPISGVSSRIRLTRWLIVLGIGLSSPSISEGMKIMTRLENIHSPKIMGAISLQMDLFGRPSLRGSSLRYSSLMLSGRDPWISGDLLSPGKRGSCSEE